MKTLIELYKQSFTISFEIFPPKTPAGDENLWRELAILKKIGPGFVSVTYGAGGSTQNKTLEIAAGLMKMDIIPLVHFTCVGAESNQIKDYIKRVQEMGISNILALRGDPPLGQTSFIPTKNGFTYANELVEFIHTINGFTIVVAGYPEGHIEAPDPATDLVNLKRKVDAGADLILTQLFFENEDFYDFIDRARKSGITIPIVPGIMPVTNPAQIRKITGMCGAKIPGPLLERLDRCSSDEDLCKAGIEYSIEQCRKLKQWGVPGFHFYTLNKSASLLKIIESL